MRRSIFYILEIFHKNGPGFGGDCDLYYHSSGNWYSYSSSYPSIDGIPREFKVDDY